MRMRTTLTGLALLAALAVAGCGGSGGSTTSRAAAPAAATGTSTSATTSASTSTTTTTTTATATGSESANSGGAGLATASGAGAQCRAAGLRLSYLGGQGATGHGELGFALVNTGSTCRTGGYPGIQFLSRSGGPLPTTPQHTTSDFFGQLPLRALTLTSGQTVSFRLGVSHGGGSSTGCATAYGLQVIPPNDTATLRVSIPGGASECGATTVSPLQPGTTAFH